MRRVNLLCALAALLSCAAAYAVPARASGKAGAVALDVDFAAPSLAPDADGLTAVRVAGTDALRTPGAPALPSRTVRIQLPPDAELATVRIEVTAAGVSELPGTFDVRPGPPARMLDTGAAIWGDVAPRVSQGRDTAIYGTDALFPAAWGAAIDAPKRLRGVDGIAVELHPVRYRPATGRLVAAQRLHVAVRFERGALRGETRAAGDSGIAVITTQEIADESALLGDWKALREAQDHPVTIATEADWDVTTGDATEDGRADRIRKWLKDNLEALGLGWVLLIGNPDPSEDVVYSVPMKLCGQYTDDTGATEIAPTDFYYSDLTSDFDQNGNGTYCEIQDHVAFAPDIYVGRLPLYSDGPAAADEMLARILAYEEESATGDLEWRRRMMLPDSIYFYEKEGGDINVTRWDGATIGEWFIRDELRPRGMVWTTLYEREGFSPSHFTSHFAVNSENLVDQWVRGYGFVYWAGHGSETGVYRTIWTDDANGNGYADESQNAWEIDQPEFMAQGYTGMLVDAPPPFVVHGSCSNATPEYSENLAYSILRRGAIATLAATRSAMTWHFPDVDPELWEKPDVIQSDVTEMTTEYAHDILEGYEAGRAFGEMMAATTSDPWGGTVTPYQKSIQNLYGDPLVRLVMCRTGADCDNGSFCDGVEVCDLGSCKPGTDIVCGPTDECADMVCDDAIDTCAAGASCIADAGADSGATDTDTDTDTGAAVTGIEAAGGGCALAPRPQVAAATLLSSLL
jgi:hypothetical protein